MGVDVIARGLGAKALALAAAAGGGGGGAYPQVATWADLPAAATYATQIYIVQQTTGIIGFRKLAGLWRSDGSDWLYLGLYGRSAEEIVNVPAGSIASTTVQAALNELDGDLQAHIGTTGGAHGVASSAAAGFMSAADKVKLDGVAAGATANSSDAALQDRANHTGTQSIGTILASASARLFGRNSAGGGGGEELAPSTVRLMLNVQDGATANASDAFLLGRENHTGSQPAATISDLSEAIDDRVAALLVAGSNVTLTYNDVAGTITVAAAGGSAGDWRATSYWTDFANTNAVQRDFIGAVVASGTNTTAPAAGILGGNHPGVQLWRSSTTANSGYQCATALNVHRIAGGERWDVNFATAAAFTGTTFRSGALDSITSTAPTDGIFFEFSGSGAIVGKCRANNVQSVTATLTTLEASTWYHGEIEVNADATSVTFTIYSDAGAVLGSASLTTNIPTASGRETGWGSIATNSGTTATDLVHMDRQALTNPGRTVARGAL